MPVAVTLTPIGLPEGTYIQPVGSLFEMLGKLALSGSYVAGGFALDLRKYFQKIGKGDVYYVSIPNVAGYSFEYDFTNRKVLIKQGDNANAAAAPAIEIPAAALPAAITGATVRFLAKGR